MAFDPIVAVSEGGGYISIIKVLPPLIVLAIWARLLTWADKDAVDAHLPRIGSTSASSAGWCSRSGCSSSSRRSSSRFRR
jgi:hypothetical protein